MSETGISEFMVAIGLFLVIEGLVYALFPDAIKKMALILPQIPNHQLRYFGLIAIAIGVGVVWFIRR